MNEFNELLELGEARARHIVRGIATASILRAFDKHSAIVRARKMLTDRMPPHEIAYRLAGRYETSIKTAQRRIKAALDMGQR